MSAGCTSPTAQSQLGWGGGIKTWPEIDWRPVHGAPSVSPNQLVLAAALLTLMRFSSIKDGWLNDYHQSGNDPRKHKKTKKSVEDIYGKIFQFHSFFFLI